jgi:hypothetical protein
MCQMSKVRSGVTTLKLVTWYKCLIDLFMVHRKRSIDGLNALLAFDRVVAVRDFVCIDLYTRVSENYETSPFGYVQD